MVESAFLSWDEANGTARLSGEWTLAYYAQLQAATSNYPSAKVKALDLGDIKALDTAGAAMLLEWLGKDELARLLGQGDGLEPGRLALLRAVILADPPLDAPAAKKANAFTQFLENVGTATENIWHNLVGLMGFIGLIIQCSLGVLLRPRRWRMTAMVAQIEQAGFNAIPIVIMLSFMVGAVVAFLGATILADFGASIYTVSLVGFSFLREFGVLLTAILMAGRTASSFTAQIGAMKSNEEIDAIRAQGLDPMEMLVVPRVLAMLIALPLLTFIAMMAGILGGMLVCAVSLDISPTMFLSIMQENIPVRHFVLGMVKAPVFAFMIAAIGCREGFSVRGSAQSVGEHTTSSVVQSIFLVILLDAVAALFYMEMGW